MPRRLTGRRSPFLGGKKLPRRSVYRTLSVNCVNHVFINAGEGIATALPHDERSRDKLTLADAMSALMAKRKTFARHTSLTMHYFAVSIP